MAAVSEPEGGLLYRIYLVVRCGEVVRPLISQKFLPHRLPHHTSLTSPF